MQKQTGPDSPGDLRERLRKHGLRITPQRIAVYRELIKSRRHPSADILYQKIREQHPHISYDTVNRTLQTFAFIGMAEVVEGLGGVRRYDFDREPHHHFHCRRCGRIFDFQSRDSDNIDIPAELDDRFVVTSRRVVLSGICRECRSQAQKGNCEHK